MLGIEAFLDILIAVSPFLMAEQENKEFEREFKEVAELLRLVFMPPPKPYRLKSIITKEVKFTWSRRAWKKQAQKSAKQAENG